MQGEIGKFVVIVVALVACGGFLYTYISRAEQLVKKWAAENGYRLLLAEHRVFRKGPFMWSGRTQAVYRVVIRDEWGDNRTGWVRFGDWWRGVFADGVEVRWDDDELAQEIVLGKGGPF